MSAKLLIFGILKQILHICVQWDVPCKGKAIHIKYVTVICDLKYLNLFLMVLKSFRKCLKPLFTSAALKNSPHGAQREP